jgi:hypothetical protein
MSQIYKAIYREIAAWDIYFAALGAKAQLRVWMLKESPDGLETEWLLKHDRAVRPDQEQMQGDGPWILDDYYDTAEAGHQGEESQQQQNKEWDSDNDNVVNSVEDDDDHRDNHLTFLGFHPYKEVVFLEVGSSTVAYHWNSAKVQYFGRIFPLTYHRDLYGSFVYTPCRIRV